MYSLYTDMTANGLQLEMTNSHDLALKVDPALVRLDT